MINEFDTIAAIATAVSNAVSASSESAERTPCGSWKRFLSLIIRRKTLHPWRAITYTMANIRDGGYGS